MSTKKDETTGKPASGRQSMTPEMAKKKGLDPSVFGKPKAD